MATLALSKRALSTPPSPIRKLAPLAARAAERGVKVHRLNIGQPDIRSPQEFFTGLESYKSAVVAYEQSQGNDELARAWSEFMNASLGLNTRPEHFLVTVGGSEALLFAILACCDPLDEVLVFDPTYANYLGFAAMAGVRLVSVATALETNFHLPSASDIAAKITPRTRALLVSSPNNPTGTVYTRSELAMLLALAEEHGLYLISDETYRDFVYDDRTPLSFYHLSPANERLVIIDSLSKRFSLCGARVGCLISTNQELRSAVLRFQQARLSAPTIEQFAAVHLLRHISPEFIRAVRDEYRERRDALHTALNGIPGVLAHRPEGAFYTVARLPVKDAEHFAAYLLSDFSFAGETVFLAPIPGFYVEPNRGLDEVRIAYVLDKKYLELSARIIAEGLARYPGRR